MCSMGVVSNQYTWGLGGGEWLPSRTASVPLVTPLFRTPFPSDKFEVLIDVSSMLLPPLLSL